MTSVPTIYDTPLLIKLFAIGMVILGGLYYWYRNLYRHSINSPTNGTTNDTTKDTNMNENLLDMQFSEGNRPLVVYKDMFTKSAPWIGGYDIGIGKTIISQAQKAK